MCLVCGGTQRVRHEQQTLTEAIKLDCPALSVVDPGFEDAKSEVVECGAGKDCRDRVDPDG